ncbi:hypothetical protein SMD22_01515 (plasmid) [Brevibacillus halotolerans]|nr:hypothetical protein SMD22_01515 [Brevibacillus halotolerans]
MTIHERYWRSGYWKNAVVTIPGVIKEKEFYHVVDYAIKGENREYLFIDSDSQERWLNEKCFGNETKKGMFLTHIKKVAAYAATIIEQGIDDEAFELLHRMYLMMRLLRTNSLIFEYNRESVTFVLDIQRESDKQQKERVMNWKDFEAFVFERIHI